MSDTKYELHVTGEFKQDLKCCKKRGLPLDELWEIVRKLLNGETLDSKYRVHQLHVNRKGQWECHILWSLSLQRKPAGWSGAAKNIHFDSCFG